MILDPGLDEPAPRFSVLMASYNHSGYVEEALESVAEQTNRSFEIIVVDDGSTDDTGEKVTRWMEEYRHRAPNRTRLHRIANAGQSAAFAHGFADCRGEYVCLLDSDDRWLNGKLEAVDRIAADRPRAGMIVHPLYVINTAGRRTGDVRPLGARLSEGDCREPLRRTGRHVAPATSGVVIRADIFRQLVPMPTTSFTYGADAYLTFGATLLAEVGVVPVPLAEYRIHPEGQYLRRMLSAEGLTRSLELQRTIASHFELEHVLRQNSYFMRTQFALHKLQGGLAAQVDDYRDLVRATLLDGSFGWVARIGLAAYWSACLVAPRPAFRRMWATFQALHTGLTT